nr:reverse transcriptase domain-containing protein [Tanacetum cinerariifolium]
MTTAMTAMLRQFQATPPLAPVKAVEETCVTCGGAHPYYQCLAVGGNTFPEFRDNIQEYGSAAAANYNQGNTVANSKSDLKAITTRSGVSYGGPSISPPVVENAPEATKDTVIPTNNGNTEDVQPQTVSSKPPVSTSEPANTPVRASKPNLQASIPYPFRRNDESNREKPKDQIEKFYQLFKDMSFEISFTDALILMLKFASTLKALISNKERLSEMARTLLNEHCSAVLLKNLPEKLGDPGKFLIPWDFLGMAECLALADLGVSINLMPYYVWKKLSLPDLTPTCMTLELADRSISRPVGVAEDVYVKVGSFHFLADFVVVDFDADPRVPLILERPFLKTRRALIDIFEGENGGNENGGNGGIENGENEGNENGGNGGNENEGNGNHGMNYGGFMPMARGCTFQDFLKCKPHAFLGTEGIVGLTRWFEKMETEFNIKNALKWAELMKLMTEVYCPRNEVQKMETELWNLTVKGNDLTAYIQRFHELILLCTRMVPNEEDIVERFIGGLPDNIQWNVIAANPARL